MSHTESHSGKLRKVILENQTINEYFKSIWITKGFPEDKYDYLDFMDEYCEVYFVVNNNIYEVIEHIELDDEDGCTLYHNVDGTISFNTMFYNGGTCFQEMIEYELKKLNIDE